MFTFSKYLLRISQTNLLKFSIFFNSRWNRNVARLSALPSDSEESISSDSNGSLK